MNQSNSPDLGDDVRPPTLPLELADSPKPRRKRRNLRPCHRVRKINHRKGAYDRNRTRPHKIAAWFSPDELWVIYRAAKLHGYTPAHWMYRLLVTDAQIRLGLITPDQARQALAPAITRQHSDQKPNRRANKSQTPAKQAEMIPAK